MTTVKYENDEYQEKNKYIAKPTRLFTKATDTLN